MAVLNPHEVVSGMIHNFPLWYPEYLPEKLKTHAQGKPMRIQKGLFIYPSWVCMRNAWMNE